MSEGCKGGLAGADGAGAQGQAGMGLGQTQEGCFWFASAQTPACYFGASPQTPACYFGASTQTLWSPIRAAICSTLSGAHKLDQRIQPQPCTWGGA